MKSKFTKKRVIIISIIVLVLVIGGFIAYELTTDENKINIIEKRWIANNSKNTTNVGIINNVNVIAKDGKGMLFDFFNDLKDEYDLNFNFISDKDLGLVNIKTTFNSNTDDVVFYKDHYVLVGKNHQVLSSQNDLVGKKIGLLNSDRELFDRLEDKNNVTITSYETFDELLTSLDGGATEYLFVPLYEYADVILSRDFNVVYHFNDLEKIYYFENGKEDNFNSIIKKYYYAWSKKNIESSYNENVLELLKSSLNITDKDYDVLTSKEYTFGLTSYDAYEIYTKGRVAGLVGEYLTRFNDITDIDILFEEYSSISKFNKAISTKSIDMYFGYYLFETKYTAIPSMINLDYYVVSSSNDGKVYHSINSLKDTDVYVLGGSLLAKHLSDLGFSKVNTYEDYSDLKSINSDNEIIIINKTEFDLYAPFYMKDASIRYYNTTSENYNFYLDGDATLNKLFTGYSKLMDKEELSIVGAKEYTDVIDNDSVLYTIAKYLIFVFILGGVIVYYKIRNKNRVVVSKRIKREDKIKYIDSLTSLKNRTYLADNIEAWNKNRVYPQTTIIVDLNNVAEINDTNGSAEGDKQIKAAANILIKTQLDNSDIIRTDGNEFLIYLIGYEEKKIANYLRKLYKEFTKLPYQYGAAIGYSMINDDIKTLDDAIIEATADMREKKEIEENVEEVPKDN